jgi:hypothetical protein
MFGDEAGLGIRSFGRRQNDGGQNDPGGGHAPKKFIFLPLETA